MPPKAPPSAGVKKKIVKTIRKIVPKIKTPNPDVTPSAADADAAPPIAAPEPIPIDTTPSVTSAAVPDSTPTTSDPAGTETPATELAAPELIPEPSESTAALEPTPEPFESTVALEPTPEPSESTVAPETTSDPAESAAAPESTPDPSESAVVKPATKTTTRVRKVVKKKIVVKRIPKVLASTVEGEEKAVVQPAAGALNPTLTAEIKNPSTDAAASEAPAQQEEAAAAAEEGMGMSERRRRKKTEIFIGGLDRDAKEEDIRRVFGRVGDIVEVRLMMEGQTGKNKGYAFLRYAEPEHAKKAVSELAKVEVCGKLCGASALEGNDTIFLGNIDKKWKKEDIIKLLQEGGIEKIDTLTVMADPNSAELNRGFAFLELETNRDAQVAYKKLQKKDIFGKGRNVKVAWAEPMNDPDEEEMQKVKSVYFEGIPSSWDENKVRESFKRFGEIKRIVLARNIQSAKRKDFAFVNYTTREAALSCVESFDKEGLTDNGSKVNAKVSLAKPVQKSKQNKGVPKSSNKDNIKEKPKAVQRNTKVDVSSGKGKTLKGGLTANVVDKKSSTTRELLHVLREQATWKQEQTGYSKGPAVQDYTHALHGAKRPFPSSGNDTPYSDLRGYPRSRLDNSFSVTSSSYGAPLHGMAGSSLPYYQHSGVEHASGGLYGALDHSSNLQGRQGGPPYGSSFYNRY